MNINVKDALSKNGITQKKFAEYLGISREGLNKSLNHAKQKKSLVNNLMFLVAEERGLKIQVDL